MSGEQVHKYADEVHALIEQRLRIKARTLPIAIKKAGRLLPKWAHRDVQTLMQAQDQSDHPKLRLQLDDAKISMAHANLVRHLEAINPNERRVTALLGMLGVISFNLILVAAAFIAYLVWAGHV